MTETIRLHLGCGNVHIDGWTNVDSRYQPGVDAVDNIGILKRYEPDSVSHIYACHCLDHFSRWDIPRVFRRWCEILEPNGTLWLSVIDFHAIVTLYNSGTPMERLTGLLVAAQDYDSNVRHMHWNLSSLCRDLTKAGFTGGIRKVDDEHFYREHRQKDCSTAVLGAVPVSLNIVTQKPG